MRLNDDMREIIIARVVMQQW